VRPKKFDSFRAAVNEEGDVPEDVEPMS
jgi:hypothetical protein